MKLLVTGGCGFIGSHFVRFALNRWPECRVTVLDKLTYAGNRANLEDLIHDNRLRFVRGDICDAGLVQAEVDGCSAILNFAAETHVDRSIQDSGSFVRTDVEGTRVLLDAGRHEGVERFLQVSTDEVYGDVPPDERVTEQAPLRPRSPYAASKAAGDLMVGAYHTTFGMDTVVTRSSNNVGPYQFPEKLIPLFVTNAFDSIPLPVYGDGMQERDWLHVEDHCSALAVILLSGGAGETYNVGSGSEWRNKDVVAQIVRLTGASPSLIRHVEDRPGHDRRYAMDCTKVLSLGWRPQWEFMDALESTVEWYRRHEPWWRECRSGAFEAFYESQYGPRLPEASA